MKTGDKHCELANKECKYVKDGKDYQVLKKGNKVICNLQAMANLEGEFVIKNMTECPLSNGRKN
jgi:hypothetical protein